MKINDLKKIIKESVREVFQEEMKSLLLEAIRGGGNKKIIREEIEPEPNSPNKNAIQSILEGMGKPQTSNSGPLNLNNLDKNIVDGELPEGDVPLHLINSLSKR